MGKSNATVLSVAGATAGLAAWAISEPFVPTVLAHGVRVGLHIWSLGSFYGWFSMLVLGALIGGALGFVISRSRTGWRETFITTIEAAAIAGVFTCAADALSDLIDSRIVSAANGNVHANHLLFLIYNLVMATTIALSVAISCQPTAARMKRGLLAGLLAGVLVNVVMGIFDTINALILLAHVADLNVLTDHKKIAELSAQEVHTYWTSWNPTRLGRDVCLGVVIGLVLGVADAFLRSAWLRREWPSRGPRPPETKMYPLDSGPNRIGSMEGVEVPLFGEPGVLPVHALLDARQGHWVVVANAPEGVVLDGAAVQEALVPEGSILQIGPATFRLVLGREGRAPAYEPPPIDFFGSPSVPAARIEPRFVDPFGNVLAIPFGSAILGRGDDAGIRIDYDPTVSRRHAELVVTPTDAAIYDLGSTSGTFVNQTAAVGRVALANGDQVRVGSTTLTFRC